MYSRQFRNRSRPPVPPPGAVQRWNSHLTDWKPLFLISIGVLYAAGYLARALNAWNSSLGVLPAFDFQYFVAGLFLLVPLGALGAVFIGARGLLRRYANWERLQEGRRKRTDMVLAGLACAGIVLISLLSIIGIPVEGFLRSVIFLPCFFVVLILLNMVRDDDKSKIDTRAGTNALADATQRSLDESQLVQVVPVQPAVAEGRKDWRTRIAPFARRTEWLMQGVIRVWAWSFAVYLGLCAVAIICFTMILGMVLLPYWPQELGGAKPRCLTFDVEMNKISPELAELLFEGPTPSTPTAVRRTRGLNVHFSNSEFVIIRLPWKPQIPARTLEIKRTAVMATLTCA